MRRSGRRIWRSAENIPTIDGARPFTRRRRHRERRGVEDLTSAASWGPWYEHPRLEAGSVDRHRVPPVTGPALGDSELSDSPGSWVSVAVAAQARITVLRGASRGSAEAF